MDVITENTVVPMLRFKEFNDNWQQKTLGDVGELINGLTYSPKDITDDGVLVLRSSNVQNNQLSFKDNKYVNVKSFNPVKENDILICVRNGSKRLIGKNCLIDKGSEGIAFGAFMTIYRSLNNKFIFYLFSHSSYYRTIHQNLGATINSINNNDLKKFKFFFPSLVEQEKIASFLSAGYKKLQQLTKKKGLLKEYKKGVMQKIFSQELRFKDDNGNNYPDWKTIRLYDIADVKRGAGSQYIKYLNNSDKAIRLVRISDFLKNERVVYIERTRDIERFILEKGDILIAGTGATAGITFLVPDEFIGFAYSYNAPKIKVRNNDVLFIYCYLISENILNQQKRLFTGNAQPFLDTKAIKNFKINLPHLSEQKKIANFLSSLDNKIELVSTQIENTKAFRKGLLQQMFV